MVLKDVDFVIRKIMLSASTIIDEKAA